MALFLVSRFLGDFVKGENMLSVKNTSDKEHLYFKVL